MERFQFNKKHVDEAIHGYRRMVKECPNNDMTDKMLLQAFYRGLTTTNQSYVNQLAMGNIMNKMYQEANEIIDEMEETSSA
ncbi:hypothetical protein RND71_028584 [Anisodus tanguticus]|uniref:Uncharacterized protein n=1 Tax=Anisodus tanguticus TaxID=243964 RepID=A0AAE1V786_9SOLA|nr:hypothetical protein RND71_028584 [Anisodus tanguticus]